MYVLQFYIVGASRGMLGISIQKFQTSSNVLILIGPSHMIRQRVHELEQNRSNGRKVDWKNMVGIVDDSITSDKQSPFKVNEQTVLLLCVGTILAFLCLSLCVALLFIFRT